MLREILHHGNLKHPFIVDLKARAGHAGGAGHALGVRWACCVTSSFLVLCYLVFPLTRT